MADKPFKSSISGNQSSSDFVSKVHRITADLERLIHNLSVDGMMDDVADDSVGAGLRGSASLISRNQSGGAIAKKKEEERKRFVRAVHAALRRLDEINDRLAELDQEIGQHKENINVIDQMIDELQANGELEVNEDGSLKSDEYERQRKAYEKRTGKKLDPNDPDAMIIALMEQRAWEENQLNRKSRERNELEDEKEELETKLDQTSQIVDRDERIRETGKVLNEEQADTREAAITDMEKQVRKDEARESLGLDVETQSDFDQSGQNGDAVDRVAFKPSGFKPTLGGLSTRPTSIAKLSGEEGVAGPKLSIPFKAAAIGDGSSPEPATMEPIQIAASPDASSNMG